MFVVAEFRTECRTPLPWHGGLRVLMAAGIRVNLAPGEKLARDLPQVHPVLAVKAISDQGLDGNPRSRPPGRVPGGGVRAVGKWPATARLLAVAAAGCGEKVGGIPRTNLAW